MTKNEALKVIEKLMKGRKLARKAELKWLMKNFHEVDKYKNTHTKIMQALQYAFDAIKEKDKLMALLNRMTSKAGGEKSYRRKLEMRLKNDPTEEEILKILCACDRLPDCSVNGEHCSKFDPRIRKVKAIKALYSRRKI